MAESVPSMGIFIAGICREAVDALFQVELSFALNRYQGLMEC